MPRFIVPHFIKAWCFAMVCLVSLLTGCATDGAATNTQSRLPAIDEHSSMAVLLRIAGRAEQAGDNAGALMLYQQAHQQQPDLPQPLLALGKLFADNGEFDAAKLAYDTVLQYHPDLPEAHLGLGEMALQQSDWPAAQQAFAAALAKAPDYTAARTGLGVAQDMAGDAAAAQATYRAGLDNSNSPAQRALRNNLGLSLALSGQAAAAVEILQPLVDSELATPKQRQNYALALSLVGKDDQAKEIASADLSPQQLAQNEEFYRNFKPTTIKPATLKPSTLKPSTMKAAQFKPVVKAPAILPEEVTEKAPEKMAEKIAEKVAQKPAPQKPASQKLKSSVAESSNESITYAIQLGAYDSEANAKAAWLKLQAKNKALKDFTPDISDVMVADSARILWRLRAGQFNDRSAAEGLCARMQPCLVVKNP